VVVWALVFLVIVATVWVSLRLLPDVPRTAGGIVYLVVAAILGVGALAQGIVAVRDLARSGDAGSGRARTEVRQRVRGNGNIQIGVAGAPPREGDVAVDQSAEGDENLQAGILAGPARAPRKPAARPKARSAPVAPDPGAVSLRQLLESRLSTAELKALAFDLRIERDALPFETKPELALEIMRRMEQLDRPLSEITAWLRKRRPDLKL
jgi:hypothetical protein